jgi:hypothetical protein
VILSRTSNWRTVGRQLGVQVDGGASRLASTHPGALQDVQSVLLLREENVIITAYDRDTKEVMELSHVSHSKFTLKGYNNMFPADEAVRTISST